MLSGVNAMTEKTWETLKVQYCQHVDQKVGLQAQVVYPPEHLPDQPGRILAHRCSHGFCLQPGWATKLHLGRHEPSL